MAKERIKDPRQIPVQLNVSLPWSFREHIIDRAARAGVSMNSMIVDLLYEKYADDEFQRKEALAVREQTKEAGATQ